MKFGTLKNRNAIFVVLMTFMLLVQGQGKRFEPGLISNNEEFGFTISPDGQHALFMRAYGGRDSVHIFHSKKVKGKWSKPELSFFSKRAINQIDPFFTPDGKSILYNEQTTDSSGYDIYIINKKKGRWGSPQLLSDAINTNASEFFATMAMNRNIYFTRRNESNDIYVSIWKNGKFQRAKAIRGMVNTVQDSESNPFISPDESYLIFSSRRAEGFGNADLYISFKNEVGAWSYPINLGSAINTEDSEFCPGLSLQNHKFTFSRTQFREDIRVENIYAIPIKRLRIKKLRSQAKW